MSTALSGTLCWLFVYFYVMSENIGLLSSVGSNRAVSKKVLVNFNTIMISE